MTKRPPTDAVSPGKLFRLRWAFPLVASLSLVAAGLRYLTQGTGNVYTSTSRTFYVSDPVLGWTRTDQGWVWLGLDALGLVAGVAIGAAVAAVLARRLRARVEDGRWSTRWRPLITIGLALAGLASVATLAVPIAAFASGSPPEGARAMLPEVASAAPVEVDAAARLAVPAGRYEVLAHDSNHLTATLKAGGETFEARFAPIEGHAVLDPDALEGASVSLAVPAGSIETGIPLRNKHAAEDLKAAEHSRITLSFDRLADASVAAGGAQATFTATATVAVAGGTLELPVQGRVELLDAAARAKLGIDAPEALLVNASLTVPLGRTPIDVESFDDPAAPIKARLLLVRANGEAATAPR